MVKTRYSYPLYFPFCLSCTTTIPVTEVTRYFPMQTFYCIHADLIRAQPLYVVVVCSTPQSLDTQTEVSYLHSCMYII